jgi:hypothetical protein
MPLRFLLIFSVLTFSYLFAQGNPADSLKSNIELRTYLDQNEVPLNREVVYNVELSWSGELNDVNISDISEPVVTNLKLRGSGSANRYFIDDSGNPKSVKRITYYFTPLEMGMSYIDGVTVQYEDKRLTHKETLSASRLGIKIIEPLPEPGKGLDPGTILLIGIIVIFLAAVVYFVLKYLKQKKLNAERDADKPKTLEEKYSELLKNALDENSDNRNETLNAVGRLLNSYLGEKLGITPVQNYAMVENPLKELGVSDSTLTKLKTFYDRYELIKFAGEQISENELHLLIDTVELIINHFRTVTVSSQN